jgi:anti-sigma factor RsiW
MKCEVVIGSIVALLDGELTGDERAQVEAHLESCTACQGELQRLRATRRLVTRHLGLVSASAGSFDELWGRLAEEGSAQAPARQQRGVVRDIAATRASRGVATRDDARGRWRPGWAGIGGLAAAAGLALAGVGLQRGEHVAGPRPPTEPQVVAREAGERSVPPAAPAAKVAAKPAPQKRVEVAKAAPAAPSERDPAADETLAAVIGDQADPPRDLLERPDLFLDFPIVRKLDELRNLDAVLAESPDDGGAG